MSPVVASMSCSPHPAALHIAPAARLRGFCHYDFAPGELLCEQKDALAATELISRQMHNHYHHGDNQHRNA
jgi:hypothetical protein